MTRKGYDSELRAKKELQKIYGKDNIIKIAISQQGADLFAIKNGKYI